MAYPFETTHPYSGDPSQTALSLTMCTDPAHATTASLRLTLYSDAGRTQAVGSTVTDTAAGGSVRERLVVTKTSLTANTRYYPKMEYEEVSGSGTFVTISDVTDDCSYRTQPGASDELVLCAYSDPHINQSDMDGGTDRVLQFRNCQEAITADDPHLVLAGGDQHVTAMADEAASLAWGLSMRNELRPITNTVPHIFLRGNHDDYDGTQAGYTPASPNWRKLYALNPAGDDANEIYGKIVNGVATICYVEPYSQSGFPVFALNDYDCQLSSTQLTFVTDTITANEKPWFILHTHEALVHRGYRVGGSNLLQSGSQANTIHAALVAKRAATGQNIIVLRGHDHLFTHDVIDGIHYIQVGSPSFFFSFLGIPSTAVSIGYWANTDGTLPGSTRLLLNIPAYLRLRLTANGGTIEVVKTSESRSSTTAQTGVVYRFSVGSSQSAGKLRGGTLRGNGLRAVSLRP